MHLSLESTTPLIEALERLAPHDHLCLIYETREEQFATAIPFIKIGLDRGDKCVYICDENSSSEVRDAMRAEGIDVDSYTRSGALTLCGKHDTYLKQGQFDPDRMMGLLKEATESAIASGFQALRVTGEMTWQLDGGPGSGRLMEYESRLNHFLAENKCLAVCQYNRRRFPPEIILGVIRTHPILIYRGTVCHNFYYLPPEEFLQPNQPEREVHRLLTSIIDRERVEDSLRKSEEGYRRIVETAAEGVWMVNSENRIVFVNQRMAQMLGYTVEEMTGANLADFAGPDALRIVGRASDRATQTSTEEYDFKFRTKKGEDLWTILSTAKWFDRERRYAGALIMVTDITEYKRLEEMLLQSQKLEAMGRLAGGVAHDFNSLLTVIMGSAQLLADQVEPGDRRHELASAIVQAAHSASALTNQLLTFSRRQPLQLRPLDLNTLIAGKEEMFHRIAGETVQLATVFGQSLWRIKGDAGRIEQVILNLIVNARDAMPQGGVITVQTSNAELTEEYARRHPDVQPGPYVMLSLRDTGRGIDPEAQAHLFEPFFTTKEKGTGLGLSTVYGIVRQHGGNISVESSRQAGTTVSVFFPKAEEAEESRPDSKKHCG